MMRILVTGSRDWPEPARVWTELARAAFEHLAAHPEPHAHPWVTVVHGDCPTGADRHAADYCERVTHWHTEPHPAAWRRPDGTVDRAAGFRRNAEMVALGADVCLAFIGDCTSPRCTRPGPHPSHGATHTADLAEAAGIPVHRFHPGQP